MNSKTLRNILFGILVLGYIVYCYRYIVATSFVIEGTTYYVLFDDAMISMRYAYNLAHGNGLVWNPGERVEGITNPLWTGIMALVHLLPVGLNQTGLYIQILGASLLTLNLFLVKKLVEHFSSDLFVMLAAVAFTSFYAPLNSFGLLGMEVSLLTLILTYAVLLAVKSEGRFNIWIYILLAISTLVRFDMAVPYIVLLVMLFWVQKENRKQHLVWGLGLLILFLGGQSIARFIYFGEWLPNTYYLKVEGWNLTLRLMRGIYALIQFAYFHNWVLFLLPLSIFLFRRDWKVALLTLLLAAQIAYSVYVGGDAWENHGGANRYIVIVMPLYFVGFSWASVEWLKRAANSLNLKHQNYGEVGWRATFLVLFAFSLLTFNALIGEWKSIERWNLARRPDYVAGNDRNLQIAIALEKVTKPGASIAVIGAGTIPYLLPDRYAIDILGKADPYIAHQNVRTPMGIPDIPNMRPGHMKWDYAHTFGELQPDVIVQIWENTNAEAEPYLVNYNFITIAPKIKVYLKKDSTNINWDALQ
ncbi:MAG TPA: hypothetical protein DCY14_07575 [Anaerolineae bacterium]|nr:hypothetical protein [Anaerolineae bacterium]HRJ57556.1 hypothetical protein [Anaerolineales bacterium]